jgi:2-phosphosulfolactate phosphatase
MPRRVFVSLLPSLLDASRLAGSSAVVIDVLRASTTICAALKAGAARVIPVATVEDARRLADQLGQTAERPLLGGERHGVKLEGFDLGNSPLEYTPEAVGGKTVLFTTTNGTRALLAAVGADRIYIGAFANLTALADRLVADPGDVRLICAGTDGQIALEDVLCASSILWALKSRETGERDAFELGNDEACLAAFSGGRREEAELARLLKMSLGGRNLVELGYDADIDFAARTDAAPVVPVFADGGLVLDRRPAETDAEWAI